MYRIAETAANRLWGTF